MNILIFTNTFTPHVGGVARSVEAFTAEYAHADTGCWSWHPNFPICRKTKSTWYAYLRFRISTPAISRSRCRCMPNLSETLDAFQPDIVHSQHPFLLGMTALRIARYRQLPLVFTHHTLYEQYTHYVPGDSPALKRFAIDLATRYANLCDQVFAPSESIQALLQERGVVTPIKVVPTGVRLENFAQGDGRSVREQMGIPEDAFVVGHLGRLAPERIWSFWHKPSPTSSVVIRRRIFW